MSGENPMLSKSAPNNVPDDVSADSMSMTMRGRGGQRPIKGEQGKGFPRGPGAQIPGFGRPVNLQGLPQVVGLALGAPEFQRR
jgi:hypothetical protein